MKTWKRESIGSDFAQKEIRLSSAEVKMPGHRREVSVFED